MTEECHIWEYQCDEKIDFINYMLVSDLYFIVVIQDYLTCVILGIMDQFHGLVIISSRLFDTCHTWDNG